MAAISSSLRRTAALRLAWLRREDLVLLAAATLTAGCVLLRSRPDRAELPLLLVLLAAAAVALAPAAAGGRSHRATWALAAGMCALLLPPPLLPTWAAVLAGALVMAGVLRGGRAGAIVVVAAVALIWTWPVQQTGCPDQCQPLWTWGSDRIDVFQAMQGSATALLHGHDPYGPQIMALVRDLDGTEHFVAQHFVYLPGVVLIASPGAALGDVRVMSVVTAVLLGGALAVLARRGGASRQELLPLLALYASSPFLPFMTLYAWNDVYAMAGFAWWVALRGRRDRWAVAALAVAVVSKPTIAAALLPFVLWSPAARRQLLVAVAAALAVMVPFALWTGPSNYVYDVVGVYFDPIQMGTRVDSLSLDAVLFHRGLLLPSWSPLLLIAGLAAVLLRRPPRRLPDLLLPGAVLTIAGLLVARQAFFNYYFVAFTVLLLALAGSEVEERDVRAIWERPLARLGWRRSDPTFVHSIGA